MGYDRHWNCTIFCNQSLICCWFLDVRWSSKISSLGETSTSSINSTDFWMKTEWRISILKSQLNTGTQKPWYYLPLVPKYLQGYLAARMATAWADFDTQKFLEVCPDEKIKSNQSFDLTVWKIAFIIKISKAVETIFTTNQPTQICYHIRTV